MTGAPAKAALFDTLSSVARALGNGRRAEIVDVLAQGERSVDELAAEISQSVANTSQHLHACRRQDSCARGEMGRESGTDLRVIGSAISGQWCEEVATRHVAEVSVLADEYLGQRDAVEQVTAAELEERLARGDVVLLDVRPEPEYRAGHIAGARSVPLANLDEVASSLQRRREIVAYCRGPYCVYADDAVRLLRACGLAARRLDIGYPEWQRAGLPIETAA